MELDKILFIPTASPPHKSDDDFAPKEDRINMLSLAISSFDKFEISDIEFKLTGKSYTYLTLSELEKIYNNAANVTNFGDDVDFAAPGVQIYTTTLGGQYTTVSGTSFAAPFASSAGLPARSVTVKFGNL